MAEVIVTNEKTGGMKGVKPERYSLLPWPQVREIAKVYAFGAEKYDEFNWCKGYDWSKSYDSLVRHAEQFWSGENNDPESGLPHLAHAAFHCLALMHFMEHHADLDDRYSKPDIERSVLTFNHIWNGAIVAVTSEHWKDQQLVFDIILKSNGCLYTNIPSGEVILADS